MDLALKGCRALVTAASTGIGRACAGSLAAEGAEVVVVSRDASVLARTTQEIGAAGFAALDLTVPGNARRAVDAAVDSIDGLDVLVVNFPPLPLGRFGATAIQMWRSGHEAIVMCAVELLDAALPHLRASGRGRIVTITGIGVRQPFPSFVVSNAYRSAVTTMTKALSNDVASDGVTLNNIAPGTILTEQLRNRLERMSDEARQRGLADIPVGRRGDPTEVGALCAFLCSAQAAFITGQTIGVDGGQLRGLH